MKLKGFTLAEVLITLGIIGVVAALTIPTLIANTNSQKFRVQYKKTFSTVNQAVRMAIAQQDLDFATVSATCGENPATDTLTSENPTVCGIMNSTLSGATYISKFFDDYKIDNNGESDIWRDGDVWYTYQLADGSIFGFREQGGPCIEDKPCMGFIDVNGKTKPNKQVHGEEVTAYNNLLPLAAAAGCTTKDCDSNKTQPLKPKECVQYKKCMPPAQFDTKSCSCTLVKEPNPSPDPTYFVPSDVNHLTDVYPVAIYDQTVAPASRAAWYVLATTKSASTPSKSSTASNQNNNSNHEETGILHEAK